MERSIFAHQQSSWAVGLCAVLVTTVASAARAQRSAAAAPPAATRLAPVPDGRRHPAFVRGTDERRPAGDARSRPAVDSTLRLARVIGDHMVVQRGRPIPVWGWAAPGEPLTVSLGGAVRRATADTAGRWAVTLPAMPAGGPHTMTVAGARRRLLVRDILVGDVWIASGQSNMEWPVAQARDAARETAAAADGRIRHFKVPTAWAERPQEDVAGGAWQAASPQTVGSFSAVAYFFARDLRRSVDVPIGIVNTTWGGSRIEPWMHPDALGLSAAGVDSVVGAERARQQRELAELKAKVGDAPAADPAAALASAAWADPALDDAAWQPIAVPGLWEQAGYPGMDGVAWYRATVTLTEAEARAGARLGLGAIDDADVTWVNGREVGRTDRYDVPRVYAVPPGALRAGPNVIAVRVHDTGGGGGIWGAPAQLYLEAGGARRALPARWRFRVAALTAQPDAQRINKVPTVLWQAMVHPLLRVPIAGALWYQGESNADSVADAARYAPLFQAMIRDWRARWGQGDFPFLWVQLANYMAPDSQPAARSAWATLREAQTAALRLPRTAQAVAIDVGETGDIHPRDKQTVGARLARAARRVAYGQAVEHSGPVLRAHRVQGGRVTLEFDHAAGGLTAGREGLRPGGAPRGFAVAGADRRFVWADARIEGGRVVVWSDRVPAPAAVRYAWGDNPLDANLYNREGLPAAPLRTDAW